MLTAGMALFCSCLPVLFGRTFRTLVLGLDIWLVLVNGSVPSDKSRGLKINWAPRLPLCCSSSPEPPYEQGWASLWDDERPLAQLLHYLSWLPKGRGTKSICSWLKTHKWVQLRTAETLSRWAQPTLPTHRTMSSIHGGCVKPLSFEVACFRAQAKEYI